MKALIELINENIPAKINKRDVVYTSVMGNAEAVSNPTIDHSSDYNCGAVVNELEFFRTQLETLAATFGIDTASGDILDVFMTTILSDFIRRDATESDAEYIARFRAVLTQRAYPRRCNKWAIYKTISYLIADPNLYDVVERFDVKSKYFQIRLKGNLFTGVDSLYLDYSYLNQSYLSGLSAGLYDLYLRSVVERTKAAGVQFDVITVLARSSALAITAKIV